MALSDWFNQRSAAPDRELNNCLKSIQSLDSSLQPWGDTIPVMFENGASAATLYISEADVSRFFRQANEGCPPAIALVPDPPRRPRLGESSYLGPLRTEWLLSLPNDGVRQQYQGRTQQYPLGEPGQIRHFVASLIGASYQFGTIVAMSRELQRGPSVDSAADNDR